MIALAIAFLVSLTLTLLVIRFQHLHSHLTADNDLEGVQKFHACPVPRVGGIGIIVGAVAGLVAKYFDESSDVAIPGLGLLACGSPAFLAGFIEDLTKKVSVKERLAATAFSALLAGYFMGAWIPRLDIPVVDLLLQVPVIDFSQGPQGVSGIFTICLTALAITGVANAYNIIDGYNGLSGVVAIIVLLGMAYVAGQVGDRVVLVAALSLVGAIAGFLIWNYPHGLIFLGDGGAYLVGFLIADLSVMLVARNPGVSAWFPLLLSFYPIFETLFSMWRKKVRRGTSPGIPDGVHFHMLVYKRLVRWAVGTASSEEKTQRNALTSPYLWMLSSFSVIPAVLFWSHSIALQISALLFGLLYVYFYRMMVRFKSPSWAVLRKKKRE